LYTAADPSTAIEDLQLTFPTWHIEIEDQAAQAE
jgi:hypothetical protein